MDDVSASVRPEENEKPKEVEAVIVQAMPVATCGRICLDGKKCGKPLLEGYNSCEEHRPQSGRITSSGVKEIEPKKPGAGRKRATLYGRVLPTHLKPAFQRIKNSRDLLSLHNDIALTQVRLDEVIAKLKSSETPEKWTKLRAAFYNFRSANRSNDIDGMKLWLSECERLITEGNNEKECWEEIHWLVGKKAELVESEAKRNYLLGGTMTAIQAQTLFSAIAGIVIANVKDPKLIEKIRDDIRALKVFDESQPTPFDSEGVP